MGERIAVGSQNPVKVAATERVADQLFDATVTDAAVDSGVSEQPRTVAETVEGAENRAERALAADEAADFGVGIEGGAVEWEFRSGTWLVMWAAVTDGDRLERGGGPTMRLPEHVAERVREGAELGPVLDDELDRSNVKETDGAAGVLTEHTIDRTSALAHAVAGAFGPFVADTY